MIYLIGSLRNAAIPVIGTALRMEGFEVFDDWFAGGPIADDSWRDYEKLRGRAYIEALGGLAAKHVFHFDLHHLNLANAGVLVLPAGRSAHLELGYLLGRGKKGYVLMDNPERWDIMYQFATGVFDNLVGLVNALKEVSCVKLRG